MPDLVGTGRGAFPNPRSNFFDHTNMDLVAEQTKRQSLLLQYQRLHAGNHGCGQYWLKLLHSCLLHVEH